MSRIGNAPVAIPEGVEVKLDGQQFNCKRTKRYIRKRYS